MLMYEGGNVYGSPYGAVSRSSPGGVCSTVAISRPDGTRFGKPPMTGQYSTHNHLSLPALHEKETGISNEKKKKEEEEEEEEEEGKTRQKGNLTRCDLGARGLRLRRMIITGCPAHVLATKSTDNISHTPETGYSDEIEEFEWQTGLWHRLQGLGGVASFRVCELSWNCSTLLSEPAP
ncbi:hypothetical protein SKAU_G00002110 [Synaphobranchus kaupii]|uniref:Uncharacterized protein n=1 Tax=Synaphobranchus kaupii TaxID=118154 RepID=A0A9Q1G9B4_SYNKA|nr:hypothetical protein SKAU_G00002110 [Synaphobranchus kaupii]